MIVIKINWAELVWNLQILGKNILTPKENNRDS
jgi:hypothetical protein